MSISSPTHRSFSRRDVLRGAALALGLLALPWGRARGAQHEFELSDAARAALAKSRLVYISPLLADGRESRCHGEVWFTPDGDDVLIVTGSERWKSRALDKGWDQARIWVGDFGPVGKAGERYRSAPGFVTRVRRDRDPEVFERLMTRFAVRYPDAWGKWEPRFRKGYEEGSRVVLRYTPTGA